MQQKLSSKPPLSFVKEKTNGVHFSVLVFFAFMLQKFTISLVSLIMIKLFWGWELINNAARSSLHDTQHALLLLFVIRVS